MLKHKRFAYFFLVVLNPYVWVIYHMIITKNVITFVGDRAIILQEIPVCMIW